MSRPKLLDLFCGAGGCSVGYFLAGFEVVGVDWDHHPDYPFPQTNTDAMAVLADLAFYPRDFAEYAVIHASPPCQGYTTMSNRWRGQGGKADDHGRLIAEIRHYLQRWGGYYVIENVPGARADLRDPIQLRGGHFGLGVDRPRLFETNFPVAIPPHRKVANPLGVYGKHHDGRRLFTRKDGSIQRAARTLEEAQQAMGIDWMAWDDLREAIPPAYTEHIGRQLAATIADEVAA